ncbi:RagB/SusD family nutrient uptake outer membrane protein [Cellulophaga baltica 4]|uniref:RagB/SusD family nutrient uptake outer membrane protein n=1 Tax=Cellulophaga TaxID=104264 RepID=UPI000426546D|nr:MULTISPECIES: RagB/SusD family nutrient uptake outer membrane protein [Cellulophaga]KGK31965.1 glycan metabolism protein [Cellulophaga sp. E6(2014)]MBA6313422.1 RagB/SusD family nutrient uptake outer membrane protein [Cellulophaga baltica]WFO14627.1 RagB/SusD family nutrient uptake outer membrane protein [Cellulophaga baltica 4]
MKTYKYLFLLIGLSMVGCSDLEEDPQGLLAPESFFSSTTDIQTAVNGAYGHMIHENFWGRKLPTTLMLRSDMVAIADPAAKVERQQHDDFTVLTDNLMIDTYWPRSYQIIGAANQAIAGAELVDVADDVKNPITAQAYFVRAFMYFHLVRQFGAIPYLNAPVTDVQESKVISSTPADEVYANIIADLEFAKAWLPDTQVARSLPAKSAASSYLSLVYLTMGEWQKAYDEAKEVIDNKGIYDLELDPDYQSLFDATKIDASKEPIFVLDFNNFRDGNAGNDQLGPMSGLRGDEQYGNGGGWSIMAPALGVYTSWDAGDYRRAVSLDDTAVFDGELTSYPDFISASKDDRNVNQPYIAKYTRFPGEFANGNGRATSYNYSMMRYAEVLLIAAEAAVELGDNASATTYINEVRARARSGGSWKNTGASAVPADITGTVTVNDVLEERRLELSFEGIRWYDIARRKLGSEVFGASGFEGAKPGFDPAQDYLLPIPADEIIRNPNLTQTPGY